MKKLLLIDGHSILTRAFFGVPMLTTSKGVHTNAIYGFLNILFKCIDDEKGDALCVAFDLDRHKLKRLDIYSDYKGNRKPMPLELHEQVPIIQNILKAMNVPVFTLEGYEADDIIGTLSHNAVKEGYEVSVISGDRDLLQLSDEHIKIIIPRTSKGRTETFSYYPEDVKNEYGVTPSEFIELKALMGDSSDNIPGLPGVGEKTALGIIQTYHNIESAYKDRANVKPAKASKAFEEHYDMALMSKLLATIDRNVPIEYDFENADLSNIYSQAALDILRELELKTLAVKFTSKVTDRSENAAELYNESDVKIVKDRFMAKIVFNDAENEKCIGFKVFDNAVSITLNKERNYVFIPCENYSINDILDDFSSVIDHSSAKGVTFVTTDLKEQLKKIDIENNDNIYDIAIAEYLFDPNKSSFDYDDISRDILSVSVESRQELLGKKKFDDILTGEVKTSDESIKYFVYSSLIPQLAFDDCMNKLKDSGMFKLYRDIEMPLVFTLNSMEKAGIRVDKDALSEYAAVLKEQIDNITNEIYETAGEPFNINSPQQLGVILFEKLGIKGAKKTKTGYSTAADVLEKIINDHPIIPKILRYRTISKLYSTYAYGLNDYIREDGRIHGTFNQTITATGRISSTEPNLQNIPVRTEEGKEIRKVFVPAPGYVFLDADYSQVELRILASLSGDEKLINAYRNAIDIHTLTASEVFHVDPSDVTPQMRRNAKAVNFGIVYGISAFGLGEGLSISRKEASEYIEKYFDTYPGVKKYLDNTVNTAKNTGAVTTYFGRIRPVPEIKSSNFMQRSFGERIAMNSPIQGTAADIMKIAMNSVSKRLANMKSRLVLQVHDELLVETHPDEITEVRNILKDCMENAARLPVQLVVDINSGDNWYDCH